ncbi:MAG TPA: 6,7-dimethyl-8-ribityllumazine synthase [Polyangia bacterium]|nr:6,7-dimethyl-8-ribityllumazine synthase [Polyangia bacterium]
MSSPESKAPSYGADASRLTHGGALQSRGRRFAIVASRFNDSVVDKLIDGAREAFRQAGADDADVELFRCPGALEIPGVARRVADCARFDGIVCLGAVIRGATPHFDLVVNEAVRGVGTLAAEGRIAVAFGVLACNNLEQAMERAGAQPDNRGFDAAMVAVEMADLYASMGVSAVDAPIATPDIPRRSR